MASNTNTAAGSNAGQDIDWSTVEVLINCDWCGVQYDAIADEHESLCGVCQALFSGDEPANLAIATDTTPAVAVDPPGKERQIKCGHCEKRFRPSKNNNGAHCTSCCNDQASKGRDIFKWFGKAMSTQARGLFNEYHQGRPMPAIAPMTTLPSNAPTFGAQHATPASSSRKRAAESENEQFMQQNEPTAKRSRTSQQQATTIQSTQSAQTFNLLSSDPVVLAEQDRLIAEMLKLPPYGLEQTTQPSQPTVEHSQIVSTNPQQTTQPGGDDAEQDRLFEEFLNLPSDDLEEATQPRELTAGHAEAMSTRPEQTTQPGTDDAELSNLPSNSPEETPQPGRDDAELSNLPPNDLETPQPSYLLVEQYEALTTNPEQTTQTYRSDEELFHILSTAVAEMD
jgi:hypothetical protein